MIEFVEHIHLTGRAVRLAVAVGQSILIDRAHERLHIGDTGEVAHRTWELPHALWGTRGLAEQVGPREGDDGAAAFEDGAVGELDEL